MSKRPGGWILGTTLHELGATTVFGIPGTQSLDLFDGLRRAPIRTVLATHELGAAFMANGYYRASGRPGVVTTIPGPGFTCALTGVAEARHDSAALLILVPIPEWAPDRRFQLQEIDHQGIAGSLVKASYRIDSAATLTEDVRSAWRSALEGEPGPVLVEIGTQALAQRVRVLPPAEDASVPCPHIDPATIREARQRVAAADRILMLVGQGAAGSAPSARKLVDALGACVVSTTSGRGVLPDSHPAHLCPNLTRRNVGVVNRIVAAADLVLALGCKLSHNGSAGFRLRLPQEKLIHVDASAETLAGSYPASMAIQADVEVFLSSLGETDRWASGPTGWSVSAVQDWQRQIRRESERSSTQLPGLADCRSNGLAEFFDAIQAGLRPGSIVVTDSGLHQVATRRFLRVDRPRSLITPADYQSVGYGLPAAIGASIAEPSRLVVAIVGDGAMAMSGLELTTAVRENTGLKVVVFNDGYLGQIRLAQLRRVGRAFATDVGEIRFERLAEAVGASHLALDGTNLHELPAALDRPGTVLIEVLLSDVESALVSRARGLLRAGATRVLPSPAIRALQQKNSGQRGE